MSTEPRPATKIGQAVRPASSVSARAEEQRAGESIANLAKRQDFARRGELVILRPREGAVGRTDALQAEAEAKPKRGRRKSAD